MVEIPVSLDRRPRAANGYVVPYVQLILPSGQPDFRVHDFRKVTQVVAERRCALCGDPMKGRVWFAGGPRCLEHRTFVDPPAHRACLRYAFLVCPFLASPSSVYSQRSLPGPAEGYLIADKVSPNRPPVLYAMQTTDFKGHLSSVKGRPRELLIKAEPFTQVIEEKDFI